MITKTGAAKALKKRLNYVAKPINLDPLFTHQNNLINDTSRYLVAQCSRRAGKTNAIAIRFFKTLERHPKSQCLYLSLTRESAKEILWPVLIEMNDKYELGCTFVESNLTMKHPNGSKLVLFGADMKEMRKRLKGRKHPGIAVDEAQDFGGHLQSLVDDVLTPSIVDYADGWLLLTGTPGPVPSGFFFDVTQNARYGFSIHKWTILDNPYIPNSAGFIADIMAKREWDDNNPTLLREWRNKWVLDVNSLWVRYSEKLNHYQELPKGKLNVILGVDIGFKDSDALAVIGWSENSPDTYLLEEIITPKQGITELVEQIEDVRKRYDVQKIVMDEGGLGKKIAEEVRRRHHIPVHPADKIRKQENVELLNDHMRLGKFKAKGASRFAQDSYLIQIDWDKSTPDKIVIKKKPHSDIIDAVLYAFKESPAYTYVKPPEEPKWGTEAWAKKTQDDMFDKAREHFEDAAAAQLEAQATGNYWDQND